MTFIIALAIATIIVTYICCVKKKCKGTFNLNNQSPQQRVYEEVGPPNQTVNNDVELQLNPAYGTSTSYNVNMNHTNPVYIIMNSAIDEKFNTLLAISKYEAVMYYEYVQLFIFNRF